MPIEVKKLGLQPKVEMSTEVAKTELPDGSNVYSPVYNASLVDSVEITATGKEVHDPEFAKLLDDTTEHSNTEDERRESVFGNDWISTPDGKGQIRARNDQIQTLKGQGYGRLPRTPRISVPALPWNSGPKRAVGRTLIRYRDGRRLVIIENGVAIKREGE